MICFKNLKFLGLLFLGFLTNVLSGTPVDQLLEDLSHPDFDQREATQKKLIEEVLQDTSIYRDKIFQLSLDTEDIEVEARLQIVLKAIYER